MVSGASRGIGLACAVALARRGLRVALLAPASDRLERAEAAVEGALAIPCDVSVEGEVSHAADVVLRRLGAPRVVVANAGIVRRGRVEELSVDDFDRTLAVNLRGTFLLARAFLPSMRRAGRGRLVAIASISATLGTAGASAYNASKWGTVGLVKCIAEEVRGSGVQAIAINPGSVDTDMLKGSPYHPEMSADDVAGVVAYAALDAPDAMNGASIDVFGP